MAAQISHASPSRYTQPSTYQRVVPPRPAGMLGARPLDVVVIAHRGLEGFAEIRDIWSGGLVG
jgi:hypothetical protein